MSDNTVRRAFWLGYLALLACMAFLFAGNIKADEWDRSTARCYPNFDDFDYRYRVADGPDAIVWWCDAPGGLQTNARAGELGKAADQLTRVVLAAVRDPASFDLAVFRRPMNDAEQRMANELTELYAPRCYVQTTALTTAVLTSTSQNTPGPSKVDAQGKVVRIANGTWVACGWRLKADTRYCLAAGRLDTVGRMIETDGWVPCRIVKAPDAGWAK